MTNPTNKRARSGDRLLKDLRTQERADAEEARLARAEALRTEFHEWLEAQRKPLSPELRCGTHTVQLFTVVNDRDAPHADFRVPAERIEIQVRADGDAAPHTIALPLVDTMKGPTPLFDSEFWPTLGTYEKSVARRLHDLRASTFTLRSINNKLMVHATPTKERWPEDAAWRTLFRVDAPPQVQ